MFKRSAQMFPSSPGIAVMEPPVEQKAFNFEPQWQVILYNDDCHSQNQVVQMLQELFGHPLEIAMQIMHEAHTTSRALAHVGSREECILFKELGDKARPPFTMGVEQISL